MTRDHYLHSMIIEALLANGMSDLRELEILAQQHLPAIRRIFITSGFDDVPLSGSLYEQLVNMITDYFSIILPYREPVGAFA